nr:ribonuclease H-like domain-containing protein [Tanacetum cinerariifolium]
MKEIAIKELRWKLEVAQKEKHGIQLKVDKFKNASKSLNKLIDCQIVDNCKKRLGYENYNAVPPSYTRNFMPLKPDLSFTGLDEFANKLVVENTKSSEEETKAFRKNVDSLIIEEWVSDNEEENVSQLKIEKKTVRPSIVKKNYVKPRQQEKTARKTIKKVEHNRFTWVFFLATKDETSVILKSFIKRIENLVYYKVKVIRCDNGTEFKNREMNQFCEMKGILSKYSVARTPQQNRVTERRNRTLIEAARTMLADSKLPTTFWAEAVNTACYVQNRVLVVKPHNKTPYELFYGSDPDWLFDIDALTRTMNYEPIVTGTQSNGFAEPKSYHDDGFKPSSDDGKKVDEDLSKGSECNDQEKEDNGNNTNNVNDASTNEVNVVGENISSELPFDPNMLALEDISTFNFSSDHEDEGEVADMNNLDITIQVSPALTTRIHKDHPLDQIKEEVYVCQPPGFKDLDFPDRVYKVEKALYGFHQAPRAWFTEVKNASTPMETQKPLLKDEDVCACARYQVNPKVSHFHVVKRIFRYLKDHPKLGLWYPKDSFFDLVAYTDSDYTGASLDKKSKIGGCQYLGSRLISWQCKKQTMVANFTTEAEYVAAFSCCGQVLWIQN